MKAVGAIMVGLEIYLKRRGITDSELVTANCLWQRKTKQSRSWRCGIWREAFWSAFKASALVARLNAKGTKSAGGSVAFPRRPQKVTSTMRSGSGQRGCRKGKREKRKCNFPNLSW